MHNMHNMHIAYFAYWGSALAAQHSFACCVVQVEALMCSLNTQEAGRGRLRWAGTHTWYTNVVLLARIGAASLPPTKASLESTSHAFHPCLSRPIHLPQDQEETWTWVTEREYQICIICEICIRSIICIVCTVCQYMQWFPLNLLISWVKSSTLFCAAWSWDFGPTKVRRHCSLCRYQDWCCCSVLAVPELALEAWPVPPVRGLRRPSCAWVGHCGGSTRLARPSSSSLLSR